MRVDRPELGREHPPAAVPKAPNPSKRGIFSDPGYDRVEGAGDLVLKAEHAKAIQAAAKPLYGGLVGSRCDPVQDWPPDHDEAYGVPEAVKDGIDPEKTFSQMDSEPAKIADKPGVPHRKHVQSDLSGDGKHDMELEGQPYSTPRLTDDAKRQNAVSTKGLIEHH